MSVMIGCVPRWGVTRAGLARAIWGGSSAEIRREIAESAGLAPRGTRGLEAALRNLRRDVRRGKGANFQADIPGGNVMPLALFILYFKRAIGRGTDA